MLECVPGLGVAVSVPRVEPIPKSAFVLKDKRFDPLVGVTLHALETFAARVAPTTPRTAHIALTDRGCTAHLNRVFDSVRAQRPRQAFFARASNTMLASYPAMAVQSHGPCFALSGSTDALRLAFASATALTQTRNCDCIVLIAADDDNTTHRASVIAVTERSRRLYKASSLPDGLPPVDLLNLILLDSKEPLLS